MIRLSTIFLFLLLPGCAFLERSQVDVLQAGPDQLRPQARHGDDSTAPAADARTAEEFDTTSAAERDAATSATGANGSRIGTTIASLGAVTEPGFWLKTPLVQSPAPGRVELPGRGTFVNVDLIPLDGPASAGSQLSLGAMRLLGVALTDLPEISVHRR